MASLQRAIVLTGQDGKFSLDDVEAFVAEVRALAGADTSPDVVGSLVFQEDSTLTETPVTAPVAPAPPVVATPTPEVVPAPPVVAAPVATDPAPYPVAAPTGPASV